MRTRLGAIVTLTLGMLLLNPGVSDAHDRLIDSAPRAGESLTASPEHIRLTYSASVLELAAAVMVDDQDGTVWPTTEPVFDGPDVTVDVEAELPDGRYQVRWRVVSSDGHPISGLIPFTVGDPPPADDAAVDIDTHGATGAGGNGDAGREANGSTTWLRTGLVGAAGAAGALLLLLIYTRWRPARHARTSPHRHGASTGDPT